MILRTDYRAVNGKGVTLYTFGDKSSALAWAEANSFRHEGLRVERLRLVAEPIKHMARA